MWKKLHKHVTVEHNTYHQWIGRLKKLMDKFNDSRKKGYTNFVLIKDKPEFELKEEARDKWEDEWEILLKACQKRNEEILHGLGKRYRSDRYVPRDRIRQAFEEFTGGRELLLVLVGKGGRGKSCFLCNLVQEGKHPALLLLGEEYQDADFRLPDEVDTTIRRLLESESPEAASSIRISDINRMASRKGSAFLLLLDSLDEFQDPPAVLESLTRWVVDQGRTLTNVRICLTCRKETWEHLFHDRRKFLPRGLMYPCPPERTKTASVAEHGESWVEIGDFDDDELEKALEAYGIKGYVSFDSMEALRDPFMLGLAAECFEDRERPLDILKVDLFERYWEKKIGKRASKKGRLILHLAEYFHSEGLTQVDEDTLLETQWCHRDVLHQLLDTDVLIRVSPHHERYGSRIRFFHPRFFEYVLARSLHQNRDNVFENLRLYLTKAESWQPLEAAIAMLLGMLDGNLRRELCWRIATFGDRWQDFVCRALTHLDFPEEEDFGVVGTLIVENPYSLSERMYDFFWSRPEYCMALIDEVVRRALHADPDHDTVIFHQHTFSFPGLLNFILDVRPTLVDRVEQWFCSCEPRLKAMATLPYLSHLARHDKRKGLWVLEDLVHSPHEAVRGEAAGCVREFLDDDTDAGFSVWSDLANDESDFVRERAVLAADIYVSNNPSVFSKFKKWEHSESTRLRESFAHLVGLLLRAPSGEIWEKVLSVSPDPEDEVRIALFSGLSKTRFMGDSQRSAFELPEVLELLESAVRDSDWQFREKLAFSFTVSRSKAVREVCRRWITHKERTLRHFGTLFITSNFSKCELQEVVNVLHHFAASKPSLTDSLAVCSALSNTVNWMFGEARWRDVLVTCDLRIKDATIPFCTWSLPRVYDPKVTNVIERLLTIESWRARAFLIREFCSFLCSGKIEWRGQVSLRCLQGACLSRSATVRRELTEGLCSLISHYPELVSDLWPLIETLREDPDWWVQVNVATRAARVVCQGEVLTLLKVPVSKVATLLESLSQHNRDWAVRGATCLSAASLPPEEMTSFFKRMAQDEDPFVTKWAKRLRKRTPGQNDFCNFYAEIFCRDLARFQQELAYDLPVRFWQNPEEACAFVAPMLKFNRGGTMKMLEEWAEGDDETLRVVAQSVLGDASRQRAD